MGIIYADNFMYYNTPAQRGWASTGTATIAANGAFGSNNIAPHSSTGSQPSLTKSFNVADRHATIIVNFYVSFGAVQTSFVSLYGDGSGTAHGTLEFNSGGVINLRRGNDVGTVLAATPGPVNAFDGSVHHFQWKLVLSDTVGLSELKMDGVTLLTFSGDTKNAGTGTTLDSIMFDGSSAFRISHLIICNGAGSVNNDYIGECTVLHAMPNSNGDTVNFTPSTGSNYQTVDETPPASADYNESSTGDGNIDLYNHTDLTISGAVRGVIHLNHAAKVGTDVKYQRDACKSGGTTYQGASQVLSTTYAYFDKVYDTDPATGVAWTAANANAAQFGVVAKDS